MCHRCGHFAHLVPYSASKFALTGLSEGLRAELAAEGIRVTTVCPGLMRTGSTYNAWFKGQHRREFAWFHVADSLPGISIGAPRTARQIIDACRHGDAELIITPSARLAVLFNAACPGTMALGHGSDEQSSAVVHGRGWKRGPFRLAERVTPRTFCAHETFGSGKRREQRVAGRSGDPQLSDPRRLRTRR